MKLYDENRRSRSNNRQNKFVLNYSFRLGRIAKLVTLKANGRTYI